LSIGVVVGRCLEVKSNEMCCVPARKISATFRDRDMLSQHFFERLPVPAWPLADYCNSLWLTVACLWPCVDVEKRR